VFFVKIRDFNLKLENFNEFRFKTRELFVYSSLIDFLSQLKAFKKCPE